ncbi:MAG: ATPase [Caulobacteraceae bacterium]|nr:ATPase [Caulobacteraceae bacterium]
MADQSAAHPRRFYAVAEPRPVEEGFAVMLDGRPVRTPRQARLVAPTQALAALVAEEWAAQAEVVRLPRMPATRLAFTAVDRIAGAREETVQEMVRFAGSDLLCYRADAPAALAERQAREWGAVLDWAKAELGLGFRPVAGVIHQPQPQESLDRVAGLAGVVDDFTLAGLALAAGPFGSAVLALALWRGAWDGTAAFGLSRLDEAFQEEQWGVDAEAAARTQAQLAEAVMLDRWFTALRQV